MSSDYYPFGLPMPGRSFNLGNPNDLNKFTGHERDNEGGLMIDYMLARNYDPEIGRFMSVDPLYNKFPSWSPYNYTIDNPMRFIDPNGNAPDCPDCWLTNPRAQLTAAFGPVTSGIANFLLIGDIETSTEVSTSTNGVSSTSDTATLEVTGSGSATEGYNFESSTSSTNSKSFEIDAKVGSVSLTRSSDGTTTVGGSTPRGGLEVYDNPDGTVGLQLSLALGKEKEVVIGAESNGNVILGSKVKRNLKNGPVTNTTLVKKNVQKIIQATKKDVAIITNSFRIN